jgi:hypothetical protein
LCLCAAVLDTRSWAVCPSGQPNQIFCDDYDCYCAGGYCQQNPPAKCPEDAAKTNGPMLQVWVLTSKNLANGNACGSTWNLEDSLQVFSEPFGNGMPCQQGAQLGHTTVTIRDDIQNTFGSAYLAVAGTDANPLVMSMNLQNQSGDTRVRAANVFYELSFGSDYAPTDYVDRQADCAACGVNVTQDWGRVLCAQNRPIPGCPDPATAPLHASIAVGFVAYLDPDPCDCGQASHGSSVSHLAVFDGQHWIVLDEGMYPGTGSFTLYGNLASLALTLKTDTMQVEYTSYNEAAPPLTVREYSVATIPRRYLGPFDTLHGGFGIGCAINSSGWDTCAAARRCLRGSPGAGRPSNDDFVLYGGEGYVAPPQTGACCLPDGQCTITSEANCEGALQGTYQGDYLSCGVVPCHPRCDRVPYADSDGDNDVDGVDFGAFQSCFDPTGLRPGCACFDRGHGFPDGRINLADLEAFVACATGPNIPFAAANHPDCPPHPGVPAETWMHEDFESYEDAAAYLLQWPAEIGAGMDFTLTGGIDGPKCTSGAKTDNRRHTHDLVQHIQAAPGGAGKTAVNGTDEAPLIFEAAYLLNSNIETARRQDFFLDLASGGASTPRGVGGVGPLRSVLGFGAFTAFNDSHVGYREGLMYFNGTHWIHLSGLRHGPGWNFLSVKIRTSTVEITYYDQALTNGMQTQLLPRNYLGGFHTMGINSDDCLVRVQAADGFKLSGGVFLPPP